MFVVQYIHFDWNVPYEYDSVYLMSTDLVYLVNFSLTFIHINAELN